MAGTRYQDLYQDHIYHQRDQRDFWKNLSGIAGYAINKY